MSIRQSTFNIYLLCGIYVDNCSKCWVILDDITYYSCLLYAWRILGNNQQLRTVRRLAKCFTTTANLSYTSAWRLLTSGLQVYAKDTIRSRMKNSHTQSKTCKKTNFRFIFKFSPLFQLLERRKIHAKNLVWNLAYCHSLIAFTIASLFDFIKC